MRTKEEIELKKLNAKLDNEASGGAEKKRNNYKVVTFNPCPRCGSKNIQKKRKHIRDEEKQLRTVVSCRDCGMTIVGENDSAAAFKWSRKKEDRVKYVIGLLQEKGNAYIGELTKTEWEHADLAKYLGRKIKKRVTISAPETMADGLIATVEAEKTDDTNVSGQINGLNPDGKMDDRLNIFWNGKPTDYSEKEVRNKIKKRSGCSCKAPG